MALVRLFWGCLEGAKNVFHFFNAFTLSMDLAFWQMLLELVANCEAQRWFPRPPGFPFLHVFACESTNSEGRFLVAHAREAGSIISFFQCYPRFL